jgi:hypothetical protein
MGWVELERAKVRKKRQPARGGAGCLLALLESAVVFQRAEQDIF